MTSLKRKNMLVFKRIMAFFLLCLVPICLILRRKNSSDILITISEDINKYIGGSQQILHRRNLIKLYSRYSEGMMRKLVRMSEEKVAADQPMLIEMAKQLIDLPSDNKLVKFSRHLMKTPQAEAIDEHLKMKRNGFFVEAGALDGERSSNSLYFEKERGWTGLLVEMDPYFYLQLIGKNRNAFSINACLSPYPYVTMIKYNEDEGGRGRIVLNKNDELPDHKKSPTVIPCFPLTTLLLALNVSHVDYFSLDVEGVELPILETIIPNLNFKIDTLSVEYGHGDKEKYRKYMESNDYKVIKTIDFAKPEVSLYVVDFIFARKDL